MRQFWSRLRANSSNGQLSEDQRQSLCNLDSYNNCNQRNINKEAEKQTLTLSIPRQPVSQHTEPEMADAVLVTQELITPEQEENTVESDSVQPTGDLIIGTVLDHDEELKSRRIAFKRRAGEGS